MRPICVGTAGWTIPAESYDADMISRLANLLRAHHANSEVWCIFDNTASGAAFDNASELREQLTG